MRHVIKQSRKDGTKPARRLKIRPAYLILLVLMALFAFKFIEKTQEVRSLAAQEAALRGANSQTEQQNAQLRRTIAYDHTTGFIENTARSVLGYAQPNEIPIMIQPRHAVYVSGQASVNARRRAAPQPVWKQWIRVLFG